MRLQTRLLTLALTGLFALPGFCLATDDQVDFNRDIRPILSDKCFLCHGPDEQGRKADLRLDVAESAHEYAFVPGSLDDSSAWERIMSTDADEVMPPPESHKELSEAERELIKRWLSEGAKYETHWSFSKVVQPEVPDVDDERFSKSPIDAFVYRRMQIEGLRPTEKANKETLIRRVTLDLTGLPPTIAEVEAFLNDDSPAAFEKVVDRLLASKQYGERMAVDWLDIARYGDTSVFHADGPRQMWRWRDWVVDAYNDNLPFDQFTIKQLAGDLLPGSSVEDKVASGFNRNNASTDEGGAIAEEFRVEYAVDRVKTTSMVWMGLSMECAQCHDHKYDPITQEEYYQFFAYFNQAADPGMQTRSGNQQPTVDILDQDKLARIPDFEARIEAAKSRMEALKRSEHDNFVRWLAESRKNPKSHDPPADMSAHFPLDGATHSVANAKNDQDQAELVDVSGFPEGKLGRALRTNRETYLKSSQAGAELKNTDSFSFGCWVQLQGGQSGAPIARMNDGNGHRGFDLYLQNGGVSVHLIHRWPQNALKVTAKATLKKNEWYHLFATYDGSMKPEGVRIFVNGKHIPSKPEANTLTKDIRADVPFTIGRRTNGSNFVGLVDDVRIYKRKLSDSEVGQVAMSDPLPGLLAVDPYWRTTEQESQLKTLFLERNVPEFLAASKEVSVATGKIGQLRAPLTTVMVMKDVDKPRMTYVLNRGQYDSPNKEKPVSAGVPKFLPPVSSDLPNNRLGMAKWLVSADHPLTSRVTVNRYWKLLFGTGIVKTLEDFGMQGQWPAQPELLDWLAADLMQNGWDVKRLMKQMIMSETYQQASRSNSSQLEKDANNRFLSRGPRFRLAGEFLRDQALAASGLLNAEMGGPGVKPYQPAGLWNEVSLNGNLRFKQDSGEKLYRRSLYTYWKRSAPPPSMIIFDAPTREKCIVRRGVTNTPLQALVLMNDPQFVEAYRKFAAKVIQSGGETLQDKLKFAFRSATARLPSEQEIRVLQDAYETEKANFAKAPERARELLSVGEKPRDESLDLSDHAAWTMVVSMIFNLDEVVTRG